MTNLTSRSHPLLDRILMFLMPFFSGTAVDRKVIMESILETLGDYRPTTRVELLQAAQVIALSMSSLDSLGEAFSTELTASMRLRLRGGANALNRSAEQTLRSLDKRQAAEPVEAAQPPDPLPIDPPMQDAELPPVQPPTPIRAQSATPTPARPATPAPTQSHPAPEIFSEAEKHQIWADAMRELAAELAPADRPVPVK